MSAEQVTAQHIDFSLPREKEIQFPWKRSARIGDIYITAASIGIPNENPFAGFVHSHQFPHDVEINSPQVQDFHVNAQATLMTEAMNARGWDYADVLYASSVTAHDDVAERIADELRKRGKNVNTVLFYNHACFNGISPLVDVLLEHEGDPIRIIGGPFDAITGDMTRDDHTSADMFGVGYGAIAVKSNELEILGGKTTVFRDTKGAVRMPLFYQWEPGTLPPPKHYAFENGGEVIYQRTAHGSKLKQHDSTPEGSRQMAMNSKLTLYEFRDHAIGPMYDPLAELYEEFGLTPADLGETLWHQPSKPVRDTQTYAALHHALERSGITEYDLLKLRNIKEEDLPDFIHHVFGNHPPFILKLPWIMNRPTIKVNNVSGVTTFVMMIEMADQGRIKLDTPTPLLGLGIGIIVGSYLVEFHNS